MDRKSTLLLCLVILAQLYTLCLAQTAPETELSNTPESPDSGFDDWDIQLIKDSRSCCLAGEGQQVGAAGSECIIMHFPPEPPTFIPVPDAKLLIACCVDSDRKVLYAHDTEDVPLLIKSLDIWRNDHYPSGICNLGFKIHIESVEIYGGYLRLWARMEVDCGPVVEGDGEWVYVYFDETEHSAAKYTFTVQIIGPTLYLDLSTKVNADRSINIHGHATGTGIIGNLDESFDVTLDDPQLRSVLEFVPICPAH